MKWRTLLHRSMLLLCVALAACSGGAQKDSTPVTITISTGSPAGAAAPAPAALKAPLVVSSLRFTISAPDMTTIKRTVAVTPPQMVSVAFDVPTGPGRLFVVEAKSPSGKTIYQGGQMMDLDGTPKEVTVVMQAMLFNQLIGSMENEEGTAVARDSSGNVIIAGHTYGNLDGNANADPSLQTPDAFVTKFDAAGNKLWTVEFGTKGFDLLYSAATDSSGNIFVAGSTTGNLGGGTNAGGSDCFVAKLDPAGALLWTRLIGSSGYDFGETLSVDRAGSVYVAGYTDGSLSDPAQGPFTNAGGDDIFVAQLDSTGSLRWLRQRGSADYDFAEGIAVSGAGDVYVAGYTSGGLDGNQNPDPSGNTSDLVLMKFDAAGAWQWTRQTGTNDIDQAWAVAVDAAGNAYVTGGTWGSLPGGANADPTGMTADLFVLAYDGAGAPLWTKQMGSAANDIARAITVDSANSALYVAGSTDGNFDGDTTAGLSDVFVVKYSLAGVKQQSWQRGSKFDDEGAGVVLDGAGGIFVAGTTRGGYTMPLSDDAFLIDL